jgi:hypothetical protein
VNYDCFMAERTNRYQRELRRYVSDRNEPCVGGGMPYHNAVRPLDIVDAPESDANLDGSSTVEFCPMTDIHWPVACACGYLFKPSDEWQWNQHRLYRRPGSKQGFTLAHAPVGAIWTADWMQWDGPDGHSLVVQTPGGEWWIDGPSGNNDGTRGPSWTRQGVPPAITVRPSILMPNFHGFLTNGILSDVV